MPDEELGGTKEVRIDTQSVGSLVEIILTHLLHPEDGMQFNGYILKIISSPFYKSTRFSHTFRMNPAEGTRVTSALPHHT